MGKASKTANLSMFNRGGTNTTERNSIIRARMTTLLSEQTELNKTYRKKCVICANLVSPDKLDQHIRVYHENT